MTCENAGFTLAQARHSPHERRTEASYAYSHGLHQDQFPAARGPLVHRHVAGRRLPNRGLVSRDLDDDDQAKRLRDLVNGHGRQWPPGWVKGEGFVEPDEPSMPNAEKFSVYAHAYVGLLTDISDHTRTNYTRFIDNHVIPWFGELSVSNRGSGPT